MNTVKPIQKSNKLNNVCYDIRGPVLEKAKQMEEEGQKIMERIQEAAPSYQDAGLSMGLYCAETPGRSPEEILKQADEEMYRMKQQHQEEIR